MSQSRRPARSNTPPQGGRRARPAETVRARPAPSPSPKVSRDAPTLGQGAIRADQVSALVRRLAEAEAKNAHLEAERAADAEQLGRLLAAAADAEARVRVLETRIERERQRGTDVHGRLLHAALVELRERLGGGAGDPTIDELDTLLRATLSTLETLHDHADAVEQLAEVTKVSAQRHDEAIVARAFAAVAQRAHATQAEIELVDGLLAGVTEQARAVKKLRAALVDGRASLAGMIAQLVVAVRSLRAVTGSLATGAPPKPPGRKASKGRLPRP